MGSGVTFAKTFGLALIDATSPDVVATTEADAVDGKEIIGKGSAAGLISPNTSPLLVLINRRMAKTGTAIKGSKK